VNIRLAESGNGSPVHVDQPNHLASVGKLFTATLIAMLKERGKLDFTDRIGPYLDADLRVVRRFLSILEKDGEVSPVSDFNNRSDRLG